MFHSSRQCFFVWSYSATNNPTPMEVEAPDGAAASCYSCCSLLLLADAIMTAVAFELARLAYDRKTSPPPCISASDCVRTSASPLPPCSLLRVERRKKRFKKIGAREQHTRSFRIRRDSSSSSKVPRLSRLTGFPVNSIRHQNETEEYMLVRPKNATRGPAPIRRQMESTERII